MALLSHLSSVDCGFIFDTVQIIGRVFLLFKERDLFHFTAFAMALLSHLSPADFDRYLLLVACAWSPCAH